jgi:D-3-phosphoglycerate dehydrogenase
VTSKGRILLLENIHPGAKAALEQEGYEVDLQAKALGEADLIKAASGCVAVGIRSKTRFTKGAIEALRGELRAIGAFCIGTNQIALEEAQKRGVAVFNAPFSNTRSVAELMIAEIVMLARRLGDRSREMHRGTWTKSAASSYEIRGKTLGIVGYGHIGRQLGVIAEAMGMNVIFHDIAARLPMGNNRAAPSLDAVLREADFVTLHVPETAATKDMIGAAELAKMKKGAFLLNASRGTVVVVPALAEALRTGHLGGAAIDVFPEEPEGNDGVFKTELQELPNVILTPHIGGSTAEAQVAIGQEVSAALSKYLATGMTIGSVNFPHAELPPRAGAHRIAHIHQNVPGVLRDVNRIVSEAEANVVGQVLATDPAIGYLLMDIEGGREETVSLVGKMKALSTTIRAELLR